MVSISKFLAVISLFAIFAFPYSLVGAFAATSPPYTVATIHTGHHSHPAGVLVDSKDNKVFVVDSGGKLAPNTNVTVIDAKTNKIIDVIQLKSQTGIASAVAYDSANDELYLAGDSVYVVSGATDKLVANISLPSSADVCTLCSAVVNSAGNQVFVQNYSNSIFVIDGKTNTISKTITIPQTYNALQGLAFDSKNNELYVGDYDNGTVFAINPVSGKIVASISACTNPERLSFDSQDDEIYVACQGGPIAVISGTSNTLFSTIAGTNCATLIAADSETGNIYAVCSQLYVINGATNTLTGTFHFGGINNWGMALSPSRNRLYISDYDLNELFVIAI
jgi:YVTN family beta-propeller protein